MVESAFVVPKLACQRCLLVFATIQELRSHFKEVHQSKKGEKVDDQSDGSESSETVDSELEEFLYKQYAYEVAPPLIAVVLPNGTVVTTARALIPEKILDVTPPNEPVRMPLSELVAPNESWLILLYRGGYFAGVVLQVANEKGIKLLTSASAKNDSEFPKVLLHRRFARYTTRRKQGGGQSAHDAQGRSASSMGAQLRRFNEQELVRDIHELFRSSEWAYSIRTCRRIFISCSRASMSDLFDGTVLCRGDPRVRHIPFSTSRPSFEEAVEAGKRLARISVLGLEKDLGPPVDPLMFSTSSAAMGSGKKIESNLSPLPKAGALETEDVSSSSSSEDETVQPASNDLKNTNLSSKKKKKKKLNLSKKEKSRLSRAKVSVAAGAGSSNSSEFEDVDEEDDIEFQIVLEQAKRSNADLAAKDALQKEKSIKLAQLKSLTIQYSSRLGIPDYVLAYTLGLSSLFDTTSATQNLRSKSSELSISDEDMERASTQLETIGALLVPQGGFFGFGGSSLPADEVLMAMGWEHLSAAVSMVRQGVQVDWRGMMESSVKDNSNNVIKGRDVSIVGNKKKGKKLESVQKNESRSPIEDISSTLSPSVSIVRNAETIKPIAPANEPLVDPRFVGLTEQEIKRLKMRLAAEARLK